jgi:hypothetical protein
MQKQNVRHEARKSSSHMYKRKGTQTGTQKQNGDLEARESKTQIEKKVHRLEHKNKMVALRLEKAAHMI